METSDASFECADGHHLRAAIYSDPFNPIHLGVFHIYFGGTKVSYDPNWPDPPMSTTHEWSGMIGAAKDALMTGRWWLIVPALVCFMVIIVSMQLIIQGIKEVQQRRVGVSVEQHTWFKKIFSPRKVAKESSAKVDEKDFVFISKDSYYRGRRSEEG